MSKKQKNLTLPPKMTDALEEYSDFRGIPQSTLVLLALEKLFKDEGWDGYAKKSQPAAMMGMSLAGAV